MKEHESKPGKSIHDCSSVLLYHLCSEGRFIWVASTQRVVQLSLTLAHTARGTFKVTGVPLVRSAQACKMSPEPFTNLSRAQNLFPLGAESGISGEVEAKAYKCVSLYILFGAGTRGDCGFLVGWRELSHTHTHTPRPNPGTASKKGWRNDICVRAFRREPSTSAKTTKPRCNARIVDLAGERGERREGMTSSHSAMYSEVSI